VGAPKTMSRGGRGGRYIDVLRIDNGAFEVRMTSIFFSFERAF
jgi:hypothetical protein